MSIQDISIRWMLLTDNQKCSPWSISTTEKVDLRGNKFPNSDKGNKKGEIEDHVIHGPMTNINVT